MWGRGTRLAVITGSFHRPRGVLWTPSASAPRPLIDLDKYKQLPPLPLLLPPLSTRGHQTAAMSASPHWVQSRRSQPGPGGRNNKPHSRSLPSPVSSCHPLISCVHFPECEMAWVELTAREGEPAPTVPDLFAAWFYRLLSSAATAELPEITWHVLYGYYLISPPQGLSMEQRAAFPPPQPLLLGLMFTQAYRLLHLQS